MLISESMLTNNRRPQGTAYDGGVKTEGSIAKWFIKSEQKTRKCMAGSEKRPLTGETQDIFI